MNLTLNNKVPVLCHVDSLIIGGTLQAVSKAYHLGSKGEKVLLIEQSTHLLPQMGDGLSPWIVWDENQSQLIKDWFPIERIYSDGDICPLNLDKCKLHLEDKLIEQRVDLLYGMVPLHLTEHETCFHVILGFRSGLYCVIAKKVYDGREETIPSSEPVTIHVEFENVTTSETTLSLPENLMLSDNKATLFPCYLEDDKNKIVQMKFEQSDSISALQNKALCVCNYLLNNHPSFVNARFGELSSRPLLASFNAIHEIQKGLELHPIKSLKNNVNAVKDDNDITDNNTMQLYAHNEYLAYANTQVSDIASLAVPAVEQCEVLVVGGGTGGAVAAFSAAESGAQTTLIEMNYKLGGTGTVGGVHYYWFGNRRGFTKEIDDSYFVLAKEMNYHHSHYVWGDRDSWNPDLKASLLLNRCINAGVKIHHHSICIGVLKEDNRICGVLMANENGITAVMSAVVIDATGDGDVAALAGASYQYGNSRDRMTMWSCMAQYKQSGVYKGGIFSTSADIGDPFDYTRYLLVNRRRGIENNHDHGTYICTRESRHILGEYQVTLRDICESKRYSDTVSVCFSNLDAKGKSSSDLTYFGYLPPQMEAAIPYRSFIPKDFEGLYVIGKAISATHDALPILRMQDDVQNQGGAIGMAAALCIKYQCTTNDIPLDELQQALLSKDCIRQDQLQECPLAINYEDIIAGLNGTEPFEFIEMDVTLKQNQPDSILTLCLAERSLIVPLLKQAFLAANETKKLLLTRLLLWHHDDIGADYLIDCIQSHLSMSDEIIEREGSIKFCQAQPDHGVMCEVTYLINLLAFVNRGKVLAVFELLAKKIINTKRDYRNIRQSIYSHIESIAYAAEHRGLPDLIPTLKAMLALPELQDVTVKSRYAYDVDIVSERLACLKLALLRALARCGDKDGYCGLIELLEDKRTVVSKSAADELSALIGKNFGFDKALWSNELNSASFICKPHPINTRVW